MIEKTITIINKTGLHARPASQFVKLAAGFKSSIQIVNGDRVANGKSLINILSMGINEGTVINLKADGEDEEACLPAISDFLENLQE
jgi:phosphotransferase system HPr (HPr) family protein